MLSTISTYTVLIMLLCGGSVAIASEYQLTEEDYTLIGKFQELNSSLSNGSNVPDILEFQQPDSAVKNQNAIPETPVYTVFLSESMGEGLIKESLYSAKAFLEKGHLVRVVFRGFLPGEDISDVIVRSNKRAKDWSLGNLAFQIDPPAFTDNLIDQVPTIIRTENGKTTDKVVGALNPQYLENQRRDKDHTEFSSYKKAGSTFEISEIDLIQYMKQKASQIDWTNKAKTAWKNYLQDKQFINLPPATETKKREFNPSLYIEEDIVVDGKVLQHAGTTLNPFDFTPLVGAYLIFNGNREVEVNFAKGMVERYKNLKLTLIASEAPMDEDLKEFMALQDSVRSPVYMLDQQVKERFKVSKTPTLIVPNSSKKVFDVEEFKL